MTLAIDSRLSPDLQAAITRFKSAKNANEAAIQARWIEQELEVIDHSYDCSEGHIKNVLIEAEQGISVLSRTAENIDNLDTMSLAFVSAMQIAAHLIEYLKNAGKPTTVIFSVVLDGSEAGSVDKAVELLEANGMYVTDWAKQEGMHE